MITKLLFLICTLALSCRAADGMQEVALASGHNLLNTTKDLNIYVTADYTVSAADTNGMRTTNIFYVVNTDAGDVTFTFPPAFVNTFRVLNNGSNDIALTAPAGMTFLIYPTNGAITYGSVLMNRYAGKAQEFRIVHGTNYSVTGDFKPLLNDIANNGTPATNGLNGVDGTNGVNGAAGATGAQGVQGIQGTAGLPGLAGTSGTNGLNGAAGATGSTGAAGVNGTNGIGFTGIVRLTADLNAYGGTALTNAVALAFTVTNGGTYRFKFNVAYQSTNTTTGLTLALAGPAFTLLSARSDIPIAADGTAAVRTGWHTNWADSNIGTSTPQSNTIHMATMEGLLIPSASGTLQLTFASEVAASAVWVKRGSIGTLTAQ